MIPPSDTGLCEHSEPMDVGAVNSLSSVKVEWSSSPRDGCVLSAVDHTFNKTAMQTRTLASNRLAMAIRASHGPRVEPSITGKGKSKQWELVQMGQVCTIETSWIHDEWSPDEWNDGWSLDEWNDVFGVVLEGMRIANKRTTHL